MHIYFIRHAESHNNHGLFFRTGLEERVSDPPLSELGQRQAQALGKYLAENRARYAFDRIYISPFLRTLQTAAAFTHLYPDVPKIIWPAIHEFGGCYQLDPETGERIGEPGMTRSAMQAQFPDYQPAEEITEEGWYFLPGYEPRESAQLRANQVKQALLAEFGDTDTRIAFVSHWDFHILFGNAILGIDGASRARLGIHNTGISCFHYGVDQWSSDPDPWWTLDPIDEHHWLTGDLMRDWGK